MNEHIHDDGTQAGHPHTWREPDTLDEASLIDDAALHGTLLQHLRDAHVNAASWNTQNASSVAVVHAAAAGLDVHQAIARAIDSLGMLHGPVTQARTMLIRPIPPLHYVQRGYAVPGYGNSFYRGGLDDAVKPLDGYMRVHYSKAIKLLDTATGLVRHAIGAELYPNLAAYTALCCHLANVPHGQELVPVIQYRMPVWAQQWEQARPRRNVPR